MSSKKRSVSFFLSDKVEKNERTEAEMKAELQCLQAGEERKVATPPKGSIAA